MKFKRMIQLSANESEVLGVKIARGMLQENWQVEDLLISIIALKADFVRVKIPSTDEAVFDKLNALGFNYSIYSILVRNSVDLELPDSALDELPTEYTFELFDSSKSDEMSTLVRESWGARTATNYDDTLFNHWVPHNLEKEGSVAYALEFDHTRNPKRRNWFVRHRGKTIGFVCGDIEQEHFEGIMYSVLPEFRGNNTARHIMTFLKQWCKGQGIRYFRNDVVFQNLPSLKSIVTQSIHPVDTYLNVTISSLLSASRVAVRKESLTDKVSLNGLSVWITQHAPRWSADGMELMAVNVVPVSTSGLMFNTVGVSVPYLVDDKQMVLLQFETDGTTGALAYCTFKALV